MKKLIALSAALASAAAFATPEVQGLSVTQNADRMVTIAFTLTEKAIVTMDITTNGVSIGADNYQSIREPLSPKTVFPAGKVMDAGQHTWMWRPTREWPGYHFSNGEFSVTVQAWSFDAPPDYMVVDYNIRSNITFYATAAELPYGGIKTADPEDAAAVSELTNDVYRTSKLLLRKIPAAGVKWRMGSPEDETYRQSNETPHYVTLTNDYYVAVYLCTLTQAKRFFNTADSTAISVNTKWNVSYKGARGNYENGFCWPDDGHAVSSGSYFGYIRGRTGLQFDFLTEAEWEFACRAGTEGKWNDDGSTSAEVAWSSLSGGARGNVPGLKKPNAWGLYDMHGLVNEWVLDQYGPYPDGPVIAPEGVTTNVTMRILRGGPRNLKWNGSYTSNVSTRSAYRGSFDGSSNYDGGGNGFGVRLSCPAVLPDWMRQ